MPSWDVAITTNGEQPYSDASVLTTMAASFPDYAYCFPDYALLDGTFQNAPDMLPDGNYGYISKAISGADGRFTGQAPKITVSYDRKKTSNGVLLYFNQTSQDYCSEVEIQWTKEEEEVEKKTFYPDSARYFCAAKVPLFDTIIITFLKTSEPYRYVWVSYLQNRRMTDAGGLKIIYDDIALGAKENSSAVSDDKEPYVDLEELKGIVEFPEYGFCYPDYALLDGTFLNGPEEISGTGYVSASISNEDRVLSSPPAITFTFSGGNYSSVGISLTFKELSGDYCKKLKITWYRGEEQISESTFEPDAVEYFCYQVVEYYNKVKIEFLETSRPHRPVFLTKIDYGLRRIYGRKEVSSSDCIMEVDEISSELSSNTLDFAIKTEVEYAFDFQKKQVIWLYFDELLMGKFFLSDGKQSSRWDYQFQTQDAIGLLDGFQYYGGLYDHVPIDNFLQGLFSGTGIEYFLDDAYKDAKITGYLPIGTRRQALQQVAFALGAVVNTANNEVLQIYPKQEEISSNFVASDIFTGLSVDHSEIITGVRLYTHRYTKSDESSEIYSDSLNGTATIEFSEPYHSLTITGGEIISSGDNYAIVSGTGAEVKLSGKKYTHSTTIMEKVDERITNNTNIAEVKEATLINSENAQEVLERLYRYYRNNETVSTRVRVNEQEVGQMVSIDTGFAGSRTGTIRKMDFTFTGEVTAEVEIG